MEFKVNKIDAVKQEVEFELTYSDLAPHFEKAFQKYQKKAEIPGFRKGKAPVSMIKRMYGDMIEQASLEDVANEVYKNYLDENKVQPLGEAQMVDMDYEAKQIFKFKIKYEVKPDFELADYKGVEVNRTIHNVDEKMIDDEVKYLQSKHVTYEEAPKADGDEFTITMDVQKLDDSGIELIGQGDKDVRFYLNDPQINKEFKEQLEEVAVGEERILNLPAQEEGKTEKYKVLCKKVEKVVFPQLNEEFFKNIYKDEDIKTVEAFREKVKTDLEGIYKNIGDQEIRNNIVNELIKLNDVTVPDALVENILNSYVEDVKNQNPKRQLPKEFDEEEYRKQKRVDAILQVKWYLIRDKIIEAEKMEVTDKDIEPVIEADAKKYNLPVDKIKSVYENNPDVKYRVLDDKLMNFLIENAKIKDVEKHDHSHDDHDHDHDHKHDSEETKKETKPKKPRKKKAE
ncbi:MAG TPA: trigger factor [Ignavibacteria bacterium]|nr:trigger factor [Ignavibacteria bacterium]